MDPESNGSRIVQLAQPLNSLAYDSMLIYIKLVIFMTFFDEIWNGGESATATGHIADCGIIKHLDVSISNIALIPI